jgi:hypothetical protein
LVALLDGGEERVEINVRNDALAGQVAVTSIWQD